MVAPKVVVLHVPYTYFPDPSGGTEVYVRGLAQRLRSHGYVSSVAAPAATSSSYQDAGVSVYRFATDQRPRLDLAYGIADEFAAENFSSIVMQARPSIVHLHARSAAVSEKLIDVAHAAGARVAFTYHTPTVSCARGTMMLFGKAPCDGFVAARRCTACALTGFGMPQAFAQLAALLSSGVFSKLEKAMVGSDAFPSALRIPSLIAENGRAFLAFVSKADRVVAVSQWVRDVLQRNGVDSEKITISRQGTLTATSLAQAAPARSAAAPLKIAYFGRIDRAKGPDLLVRALRNIPAANVQLDIFAIRQAAEPDKDYEWLATQAQKDRRLQLISAIAPDKVASKMAEYDLIAVPSRWLETGPLVVLEAFAAGVPVLGANLGGIAELVRDGVDGILVAPDNPEAWAEAIRDLAEDRQVIDDLRARIAPPRTLDAVANDMAKLYADMLVGQAR